MLPWSVPSTELKMIENAVKVQGKKTFGKLGELLIKATLKDY